MKILNKMRSAECGVRNFFSFQLSTFSFLFVSFLFCGNLLAADLVFPTYVPQAEDGTITREQRQAAAIAALVAGSGGTTNVVGYSTEVSASFVRPADTTAYVSGDLVANSTTAGSVTSITLAVSRVNDGSGMIRRVRLKKTGTSLINASFRVHFYKSLPTVTNGDNGAWISTESLYLGSVDVTIDKVFSDFSKGIGAPNTGSEINFTSATGTKNIFALIEARGAYTPISGETFTLTVEALQN